VKYLPPIQETSYLSAPLAPQYRQIMRIFFNEYERMRFQLYKEDVYEILKRYDEYEEYTMEQLKSDLESLVKWRNLTPIQDPKKVFTIEDYKNKQFRYSMSEYAVEVERMTVSLENLFMESGSLSMNFFVRIHSALEQAEHMYGRTSREINEWWRNLQEDFKRLNQNYQDYLREFYSGKADKVLKSLEFIQRKDLFTSYLREFVKEMQINSSRIEATLKSVSPSIEKSLLELVIKSELEIPHPISEHKSSLESSIRENIQGKWYALKHWFISHDGRPSECSQVLEITDEVIRKVIQNAALIVQLQNWGISRKDDYKKFISLFLDCEDINEAHKLASHVFGIQNIQHFKVNDTRSTDSINSSVYDEQPSECILKPHTRTYKPRIDKNGFEIKTMEKLVRRAAYLKQIEEERKMVMKYIQNNKLDIASVNDRIPASTRMTLLKWISAANITVSKRGKTEYGQTFKLVKYDETCTLHCEDGDMEMPRYIFEFKDSQYV